MRKLLSLVVACMMLVSCFAITASADATVFTFTASAPDADGIFGVTFTSPVALKLASATLLYPADKMIVVDAGSKEAVAVGLQQLLCFLTKPKCCIRRCQAFSYASECRSL